ncbi:MAG: ABC transporter ATP-binding protein [Candidatus Hermodarchaeota archaeon]
MSEENTVYRLVNVQRYYTQRAEVVKAVNGITLDIHAGEILAVFGPSGAGKTTLLNLLAGLDKPTGGQIFFKDQNFSQLTDSQLCDIRQHNIGIIFQFYNMHPSFTAQENVEYPMMISNVPLKERQHRALELLTQFGLAKKKDNFPAELSGGEKQRVGIARALANDPEVIIADEPTGDLDSEHAEEIINLLLEINQTQQKTIVMVTHDESLIAETMILLEIVDGKLHSPSSKM